MRASRSRNRGSLALRSFSDPKCWSNRRYSVLVVWFEMPPSFRKEHRGTGALLVFLVRRQGRYFWRKTRDAVLDLPPAEVAVATGASR